MDRWNGDSQNQAGGKHELRKLLKLQTALTTSTEGERFLRNLLRRGIGTRVMEDKASGLILDRINVSGVI